jgi:hypothetical protein
VDSSQRLTLCVRLQVAYGSPLEVERFEKLVGTKYAKVPAHA